MSHPRPPDLSCYGIEPDDEPVAQTIPAKPVVGERFMQESGYGLWSVFGWEPAACELCDGQGGHMSESCPRCQGSGDAGYMEPARIAEGLMEADARLMVFGPALLAACESAARIVEYVPDLTGIIKPLEVKARLEKAMKDVRGEGS